MYITYLKRKFLEIFRNKLRFNTKLEGTREFTYQLALVIFDRELEVLEKISDLWLKLIQLL